MLRNYFVKQIRSFSDVYSYPQTKWIPQSRVEARLRSDGNRETVPYSSEKVSLDTGGVTINGLRRLFASAILFIQSGHYSTSKVTVTNNHLPRNGAAVLQAYKGKINLSVG